MDLNRKKRIEFISIRKWNSWKFLKNLGSKILISITPIILGDGLPFFNSIGKEQSLYLKDVTTYLDGMVELNYEIKE